VVTALRVLRDAGAVLVVPGQRHLSLGEAARLLDCSTKYLREHLVDFPNAWRMPGGEIRIPAGDIDGLAKRGRFFSKSKLEVAT